MESGSLRSMTYAGLKNIKYINQQIVPCAVPPLQVFLKIKVKHGIVQVA